jgi:beta-phosphoglucomutase-like phosphatase (HAD superfamily)
MQEIRAVIFDLDGLMLETEAIAREIWLKEAHDSGVPLDLPLYMSLIGRTFPDIEKILTKAFAGKADARVFIEKCLSVYRRRIESPIPTRPGLLEALGYFDSKGLKKAVGTSSGRVMAEVKLRSGGIAGRFDAMVTGNDVKRGKPEPDIFLAAAVALGEKPENCLVLEDSFMGIRAAKAAGIRAIMIPDMLEPDAEIRSLAMAVLPSLADVPQYLERAALL